jgi:quinol monooxygenase YgiN
MIVITVTATLKTSDDRDQLLAALGRATPPTLKEKGVIAYQASIDPEDPLTVRAVEIFASPEALAEHSASEHATRLIKTASAIPADVSIKAYRGDMQPFDLMAGKKAAA